jgi:hypothetical protein
VIPQSLTGIGEQLMKKVNHSYRMLMLVRRNLHLTPLRQALQGCQQNKFGSRITVTRFFAKSPEPFDIKNVKTAAGTGRLIENPGEEFSRNRGPVSWAALALMAVASASAVGYFQVQRERRLEQAMGKIVSSTYRNGGGEEEGWSPNPEIFAKKKWLRTKYGWFPEKDAFGGGEFVITSKVLYKI